MVLRSSTLYLAVKIKDAVEENPFAVLTSHLLRRNPLLRPLLSLDTEGRSLQGKLKRKQDFLPHDVKRLAIGTVDS